MVAVVEPVCEFLEKAALRAVAVEANIETLVEFEVPLREGPAVEVEKERLLLFVWVCVL